MSSSTLAVPQQTHYPQHILPQTTHDAYNMVADKVRESVAAPFPPSFFILPDDAHASFSTGMSKNPKRPALDPPPPPIARSDLESEIDRKAAHLRAQLPELARTIKTATQWAELYGYFDAQDLQVEGPAFLFYVINTLSNENDVLTYHDSMRQLRENREQLLHRWAGTWVGSNFERIRNLPLDYDLTTVFTAEEKRDMTDCTANDWAYLKVALGDHHRLWKSQAEQSAGQRYVTQVEQSSGQHYGNHLEQPIGQRYGNQFEHSGGQRHGTQQKQKSGQQQVQPMVQRSNFNNQQAHEYGQQRGQQYNEQYTPQYGQQHGQSTAPQQYPVTNGQLQNQALTNPPPDLKYDAVSGHFMEDHRSQAGLSNGPQHGFFQHTVQNWQERPRGYSNGNNNRNDRNGRQQPRGNGNYNQNFSDRHLSYRKNNDRQYNNNQNNRGAFDRRNMSSNNSWQSPPRNTGQKQGPVYVHSSQRVVPSFQNETRNTAEQSMVSEPARRKHSNDAQYQPKTAQWQELNNFLLSHFPSDPNAVVRSKSVNYYYNPNAKEHERDYAPRSVFVMGASQNAFISHELKSVMEKAGPVDYISCLVANGHRHPNCFVAFQKEDSVQKAIAELQGIYLSDGCQIELNFPFRGRSGSLSSYHSQEYRPSGHYQRDGHSRQSSMSQRQYTSPDATKSGPLTAGFQARHSPSALSEIQSTVAQLNQKHEAVTGISPNTPERSASNETRNVEHTTPSKGKGKGKKMGSIRGSNRPTSVQTPMKSRSQTNFQTHALVDITNKEKVSLVELSSQRDANKSSASTPQKVQKENVVTSDHSCSEDVGKCVDPAHQVTQSNNSIPKKPKFTVKEDKSLSLETRFASPEKVILSQPSSSVKIGSVPTENDIVVVDEKSIDSMDTKSVLNKEKVPDQAKGQLTSSTNSPVDIVPEVKVNNGTPNENQESVDTQKLGKSTKKKNKKKNKRGPIPDFNSQNSSPIEIYFQDGQTGLAVPLSSTATLANSSIIKTSWSDPGFSNKTSSDKLNSSTRETTPTPDRSDSETTLCNSPITDVQGVSTDSKPDGSVSSTNSTPKQQPNGNRKSWKSTHSKKNSHQSTSSNGSLRKADMKHFKSEKSSKSAAFATPDIDKSIVHDGVKSVTGPDHNSAKSDGDEDIKHVDKAAAQGHNNSDGIPFTVSDKSTLDFEGPKVVPKVKSKSDLQNHVQQPSIAVGTLNDGQLPAPRTAKTSSPAAIDRKLIASSAVRPVTERIAVVPAIPLTMERRRQL